MREPDSEPEFEAAFEAAPGRWTQVLKLHVPFVLALTGCLLAGWFELTRALAGREVAWVYAFEWPLFAVLGTNIWWRQLHGPERRRAVRADPADDQAGVPDAALEQWKDYLDKLQAMDPPGGPSEPKVNARGPAPDSRRRPEGRER